MTCHLDPIDLHLLDCCLVTDAGGAVVLTSMERAKDLKKRPVAVLGTGEAHTHRMISQMPDLTETAAKISGRLAFERAGVTHADIDVAETTLIAAARTVKAGGLITPASKVAVAWLRQHAPELEHRSGA